MAIKKKRYIVVEFLSNDGLEIIKNVKKIIMNKNDVAISSNIEYINIMEEYFSNKIIILKCNLSIFKQIEEIFQANENNIKILFVSGLIRKAKEKSIKYLKQLII